MNEAKSPAAQWYFGDWRRDTALQSCSLAARGLWKEMLCLMFDGSPRGYLRVGGNPITPQQLARMVGPHEHERVPRLLKELEQAGVFSRDEEDGAIFNRRMAREAHISLVRREAGSKGGQVARANLQAKQKQIAAEADAVAEREFDLLWTVCERKVAKKQARATFLKLRKRGELPEIGDLVDRLTALQQTEQWSRDERAYQPHLSTWLNREGWLDEIPKGRGDRRSETSAIPVRPTPQETSSHVRTVDVG